MQLAFESHVDVPPEVLVRDLDDESVILNVASEHYFGLDDTSTIFWAAIVGTSTLQEAYDRLLEEFDVEPERLRADLEHFVIALAEKGLLVVQGV